MTGPARTAHEIAFEALPIGEQLTVWAIRMWTRALRDAPTLHRNLCDAFRIAGVADGYLAFDKVMTILSTSAEHGITIGCTCCGGVTDDEQVMLGIVAEFQAGSAAMAHVVLSNWLPTAAVRVAAESFSEYATLIKGRGLLVRLRQWKRTDSADPSVSSSLH